MVHQSQFIEMFGESFSSNATIPLSEMVQDSRPITYGVIKPGDFVEDGVVLVRVKDIVDGKILLADLRKITSTVAQNYVRSTLSPGDILLSIRGTIGRTAIVPKELDGANITQDTARISLREEFNNHFIKCVLDSPVIQSWIQLHVKGLAVKGINLEDVRRIPIPSVKNELQEIYIALYHQADKSKFDGFKSQFIEMFGTIKSPTACDVMTVGDAVERGIIEKPMDGNHGSKHPTADEYVDSGIPFLLANNITEDGVDLVNCSFITKERASRLDKGFAHNGDVLLTHKGTVGRVAILKCPNYEFVMLTPQVTYYRPLKGLSAEYLKAYFESQGFQEEIMSIASSGATRAYIGITEQRKLHLLIPNTECQRSFVTIVKQADKSKYLN